MTSTLHVEKCESGASLADDFETERSELLESVEKCSVQAAELHRLDWENRRRADEIRELQKASRFNIKRHDFSSVKVAVLLPCTAC